MQMPDITVRLERRLEAVAKDSVARVAVVAGAANRGVVEQEPAAGAGVQSHVRPYPHDCGNRERGPRNGRRLTVRGKEAACIS